MNKKLHFALNIVLVVVVCLALFSGCTVQKVKPWEIEDSLDLVGKLVKALHNWIGSYGWTVVVFTVFLKLLMLPLDIWQRYSTRMMSVKMQKLQPLMEDIDKRYGANSQRSNEEKQKLYKKNNYNPLSSCLPMIITMVVFFVMFGGLRSYSTYSSVQTFNTLAQTYYQTYAEKIVNNAQSELEMEIKDIFVDAYVAEGGVLADGKYDLSKYDKEEHLRISEGISEVIKYIQTLEKTDASKAQQLTLIMQNNEKAVLYGVEGEDVVCVQSKYLEIQESWLWIQNIAQPDTWETIMPKYDSGQNNFTQLVDMTGFDADGGETLYNTIRNAVLETGARGENGKWNGLMILPILSVGLSFLSTFIAQAMEKKNRKAMGAVDPQQNATNKTMMIMMPLMMAYFGFIYTGAFAIYMVVNYLISILSTVLLRAPVEKMVEKKLAQNPQDDGPSYMRKVK